MSDFVRINELHGKINNLLAAVAKSNGRFSGIDKDLLTGYMRELYELVVAINPESDRSIQATITQPAEMQMPERHPVPEVVPVIQAVLPEVMVEPVKEHESVNPVSKVTADTTPVSQPVHGVKPATKEKAAKKSISEIYAHQQGSDQGTLNEKFKQQGKEIADKLKHTPIRDLRTYIGLNKRFAFINTLFKGQAENYDAVVAKVNNAVSYQEALNYIQQQVMTEYGWKEEDPAVAEFFTLVMRRYLN